MVRLTSKRQDNDGKYCEKLVCRETRVSLFSSYTVSFFFVDLVVINEVICLQLKKYSLVLILFCLLDNLIKIVWSNFLIVTRNPKSLYPKGFPVSHIIRLQIRIKCNIFLLNERLLSIIELFKQRNHINSVYRFYGIIFYLSILLKNPLENYTIATLQVLVLFASWISNTFNKK